MKLDLDVGQFQRALKEYGDATGKDGAEILNRAGRNVAYRASQKTKVANASKIRRELMADPHLRYALTSIALRKARGGKHILQSPDFARAVERLVSRRVSSSRYLRAAWANAIEKMGGTFRGRKFKGADGSASPATIRKLITELVAQTLQPDQKHARSAEDEGIKPLQDAIDFVAKDMIDFANRILAKRAKSHSA
jgi:hypothetical protein